MIFVDEIGLDRAFGGKKPKYRPISQVSWQDHCALIKLSNQQLWDPGLRAQYQGEIQIWPNLSNQSDLAGRIPALICGGR